LSGRLQARSGDAPMPIRHPLPQALLLACACLANPATPQTREPAMPPADVETATRCCRVVELRRYTLHPFKRDVLIDLFDREFVEPQEASGLHVLGTFRDLDDPDRFVWLRGFAGMDARVRGLTAFYGGPVWRAHREAANRTMVDSDDVLLLRPMSAASGFDAADAVLPPRDAVDIPQGIVVAHLHSLQAARLDAVAERFWRDALPLLRDAGVDAIAVLVSETAPNDFPQLPVREGEHVLAWFERYPDAAAHARMREALQANPAWRAIEADLRGHAARPAEILRLQPTARSRLPGGR
jgi:hypothetical protein